MEVHQSLKRISIGMDCLAFSFLASNLAALIRNFVKGEDIEYAPFRYSYLWAKVACVVVFLGLKKARVLSSKTLTIIFTSVLGLYLIWVGILQEKLLFFAIEAYQLCFMCLERFLLEEDSRLSIGVHISQALLWYSACFISGKFAEAEGFTLLVGASFCLANQVFQVYLIYRNSARKAKHIAKITELNQQIQHIFECIPEAIFVVKFDLASIMKNKAADLVIGETGENFLQQVEVELEDGIQVSLTDKVRALANLGRVEGLTLGNSKVLERIFEWKASTVTWGGQLAVTLLMRDVTALIVLEQARHDEQMKNVMLRSVSHELRTPVNAFKHLLEQVLKCKELPEEARALIGLVQDNCKHLLHVVNDLLDYSQFLHGSFRLTKQKFDLRQTLTSSFKPFQYMIGAAGVISELYIDPGLPMFGFNDPNRISQVVMNLLSNAAKFTRQGSIRVSAVRSGLTAMQVSVKDTGIGVSQEQLGSLGSLFGRLRENEGLNPQGCGLGLHISSLLAMKLGGNSLQIQSILTEGSTFSFTVDLSERAEETDYTFELEEELNLLPMPGVDFTQGLSLGRVLVVDDNVFNRDIISSIVEDIGAECVAVSSGIEAIQVIVDCQNVFQLMFLDYEMPELNGPETSIRLHQMLSEGTVGQIPVIVAYTAYSSQRDIQECKDAGMHEFLPKPCHADAVKELVLKYCRNDS
jgi:signal transduction histidine kinase